MSPKSTLISLPLLLMSALSTGCLTTDEGRKDTRSDFHDVTVSWHLRNVDGSVMSSCPQGFTTLVTHMYHDGYVEPPDGLIKTPCTPEGSLTQPLPTAGEMPDPVDNMAYYPYDSQKDIWMDLTEETQSELAARSFEYYVEDLDSDRTIDFDIYPEGGLGVAEWYLSSSFTSAPIPSCATAGVDEIEAAVRRWDAGDTAPFVVVGTWPCENVDAYNYYNPDGQGYLLDGDYALGSGHTAAAVTPGDYEVEMRGKRAGALVGTGMGYFTSEEGNYHMLNTDPITIIDR